MDKTNIIKWTIAFFIPVVLNNMVNLSERFYYSRLQASIIDVVVIIGTIGVITVQTYGAYRLMEVIYAKNNL